MGHVFRRIGQSAYLVLAVLSIVGMEIDIVSNPFGPEFVLTRLCCFLDGQWSSSETTAASPTEAAFPSPEEPGSFDGHSLANDETVAVRPSIPTPRPGHEGAPTGAFALPPLARVANGVSERSSHRPGTRLENQLCRFLC